MIDKKVMQEIKQRFRQVEQEMARPEVAVDPAKMADLGREHANLSSIVKAIDTYEQVVQDIADWKEMVAMDDDPDTQAQARKEMENLQHRLPDLEEELEYLLLPKDPEDSRNAIIEIRAGTGGDEAGLFAGDLFRLYARFAEMHGWKLEMMNSSLGTQGGFKEVTFSLEGPDVFGTMKYEGGVHRVQRVPATESSGRIHTSAATVAVLPEAEEVEVDINPEDLEVDVYRSSGPGGQSVNTTDSAVRITHKPTGLVVTCQDEKSQHKNKDKALRVLRARLYEIEQAKLHAERSEARRSMVGSGDRSAKIRTYNWPQGRVTDHRLEGDQKNYALQSVIDGDLEPIIRALQTAENARRLSGMN